MRKNTQLSRRQQITFIVQFGILLALEALFCFVLGSIPLPIFGIVGMVATLMMIPVMVTSITLGRRAGALMGFFAGLFSFIIWTFMPPTPFLAFVFTPAFSPGNWGSIIICFVPRILGGYLAGLINEGFKKRKNFGYALSAIACSATNTLLVSGLALAFFSGPMASALGESSSAIFGIVFVGWILQNGIAEAVVCSTIAVSVCSVLEVVLQQLAQQKGAK